VGDGLHAASVVVAIQRFTDKGWGVVVAVDFLDLVVVVELEADRELRRAVVELLRLDAVGAGKGDDAGSV